MDVVRERVADVIRKRSKAGQFTSADEIFETLAEQRILASDLQQTPEILDAFFEKILEENEDLHDVAAKDGAPRFYSSQFMSEAFVAMLLRKEGDPLLLIAETVRENSKIYPRPIPLDVFRNSPFNLAEEEIFACLHRMPETDEYRDIQRTTTSIGTAFLYSTLHLDPSYASMLAEWFDVGQFANP